MSTVFERTARRTEASGVSVRTIAKASGMRRMTLARRLSKPSKFTLSEVEAIATALGVSPLYLVTGSDQ